MSDPMKQAWNDVADSLSTLGRMMKERYQAAGADEAGDSGVAAGTEADRAALRDAFDKVVTASREFGDRAADIARDDDVRAQAKRALESLNDAMSATVELIGEHVNELFNRPKGAGTSSEAPAPNTPPTTPADEG